MSIIVPTGSIKSNFQNSLNLFFFNDKLVRNGGKDAISFSNDWCQTFINKLILLKPE